jgi:hypothetical protein
MKFDRKRIDWNPILISMVPLLLVLIFLPGEISFYCSSELAEGTVVKLNAGGKKPQVEFATSRGELVSIPASSFFHNTKVGEKVEMRYDPERPRIAEINQVFSIWGWFIILAIVVIAFVLKGLLAAITKDNEK